MCGSKAYREMSVRGICNGLKRDSHRRRMEGEAGCTEVQTFLRTQMVVDAMQKFRV
jgi:hypothetical protein